MKKTRKVLSVLALLGGLAIGMLSSNILVFLFGLMLATAGFLGLMGEEYILYY